MKKVITGIMLLTFLGGCGTIMEPKKKTVNISSTHKAKILYDGEVKGNGKYVSLDVFNRSKGQNRQITVTSLETGEVRTIQPKYAGNGWLFADFLIDFGIISIPIDLINGSYKKLDQQNYYVEFDDEYSEVITVSKATN